MNYVVYVEGVHLPQVDVMVTTDEHLVLRQAPPVGADVTIQVINGWNQSFIGDGTTVKFPLSSKITNSIKLDDKILKYKQILHEAMRSLDNKIVQAKI